MLSNYSTNLRDSAYEYARSNVTETVKCALPWKRMTKLNAFIRIHSLHLSIVQGFYDPQANRLFHISSLRSSLRKLDIRLGITTTSSSHIISTRNVLDQEDNGHEKVKPQEDDDGLNQAEDEDEFDEEEEDDSGEDEDLIIDEDEGEEDHELETEEEEDEDELDTEADDTEDDGDTDEDEFDEDEDEDELDLDEDEDDEDEYDLDVA